MLMPISSSMLTRSSVGTFPLPPGTTGPPPIRHRTNRSIHTFLNTGEHVAVLRGYCEGVDTFDSSCGGLGGCPVVPGGSGNVPTEDLVNMLEEMGISTGIDLDR